MATSNVHQGIVLEASPLPISPLHSLAIPNPDARTTFHAVNGTQRKPCKAINHHPVTLLIDDVLDGGNLGAVLRSAYFLGVDAVILSNHIAPLNAVALKASAGAAEALTLFKTANPSAFLEQSKQAGWHIICATTPRPGHSGTSLSVPTRNVRYHSSSIRTVKEIDSLLASSPQLIVVGGEGRGLRKFLSDKSDSFLEILAPRDTSVVGLDSLNVSVAAAMACHEVLTRMRVGAAEGRHGEDVVVEGEKKKKKDSGLGGQDIGGGGEAVSDGLEAFESDLGFRIAGLEQQGARAGKQELDAEDVTDVNVTTDEGGDDWEVEVTRRGAQVG
jgi:tRNA G18 (ribose-2'-O)-methylase SpoU